MLVRLANTRALARPVAWRRLYSEGAKPPSLGQRIRHEVKHYVNGTKLLGYEIRVSTKLLVRFVEGYELSRRERNQLKRTMSDVFRLVPFSAFVVVPFAELLLPIALKVFPNMLPSTYESGRDRAKKRDKLVEVRRKTSEFLHETLEESSLLSYNAIDNSDKKRRFYEFFKKLYSPKNGRADVFTHAEILAVAQMFKNDTVLDNLSRPQLVAMAKFISVTPFGNDNMLRYQIRRKLKQIIEDDREIDYEGVASLSTDELYHACVSRGVKAYGVQREELVDCLQAWLDLRLRHKVPSVLLVLSSTFTFGGLEKRHAREGALRAVSPQAEAKPAKSRYDELLDLYYDAILQVLSSIPDPVYNVAKLDVAESKEPAAAGDAVVAEKPAESAVEEPRTDDNEFKLNVLKEQEALIKKEQEDAKARSSAAPVEDDITLDDEAPRTPVPADEAAETAVTKKN